MKTISNDQFASALVPFMTSKHTLTKDECLSMLTKSFERATSNYHAISQYVSNYLANGGVIIDGVSYKEGINADSFIKKIGTLCQ